MKMYTLVLVILLIIIILPDTFFYRKLKDKNVRPIYIVLHLGFAILFAGLFLYIKFGLENAQNFRIVVWIMWLYFLFFLIYIPKLIHLFFYILNFLYKKITGHDYIYFTVIRVCASIFIVATMLISAYVTPRNFEVKKVHVYVVDLPPAFDGYRIVQLSDIHLGSWNKKYKKLTNIINIVNYQRPDVIIFSGDMVNNYADETQGWVPHFNKLMAKDGKFAVLGNHDYGDYTAWNSKKEQMDNRQRIQDSINNFGFRLLLNESIYLRRGTDSLLLVGVQNWGKSSRYRYSNLKLALKGESKFPKILISHDPLHWEAEIVGRKDIFLTLSGHTHAGQLGIKVGNKLISPALFAFKYWNGLYQIDNQYLYVNRGIGYIGLPMYIGISPEITVIELRRQKPREK